MPRMKDFTAEKQRDRDAERILNRQSAKSAKFFRASAKDARHLRN
jgi:hypothetical protein